MSCPSQASRLNHSDYIMIIIIIITIINSLAYETRRFDAALTRARVVVVAVVVEK